MLPSPEEIRRQVAENFNSAGMNITNIETISEKAKELASLGAELDADAVCHIFLSDDGQQVVVMFVVGRSVLMGPDARSWLFEYHNNSPVATARCIDKIASYAIEEMSGEGVYTMPFKDTKNKAWRSFQTKGGSMQTVDQVRKSALMKLGRPFQG